MEVLSLLLLCYLCYAVPLENTIQQNTGIDAAGLVRRLKLLINICIALYSNYFCLWHGKSYKNIQYCRMLRKHLLLRKYLILHLLCDS